MRMLEEANKMIVDAADRLGQATAVLNDLVVRRILISLPDLDGMLIPLMTIGCR